MKHLERATPENLGISSQAFIDFYNELAIYKIPIHNFIFLRHGKVLSQGSWKPYSAEYNHMMYSTSKSLTSLAIGLCAEEGLLSLDDHVVDFFPELITGPLHEFNRIRTIRHLLKMTSGEGGNATSIDRTYPNWLKSFLNTPPRVKPGTLFGYDSAATHTLGAIVQKVTGKMLIDYLDEKLFKPLDIEGIYWEEQMGVNTGSRGLHCKIEDVAKIALLVSQGGKWEGKQLISEEYIKEACTKQVEVTHFDELTDGNPGYCYQFWRYRDNCYGSAGRGGNTFVINPKYDIIFAFQANFEDGFGSSSEFMHMVWDKIINNISDETLPENKDLYEQLRNIEDNLEYYLPEELDYRSDYENIVNNKKYILTKNDAKFHDITMTKTDKGLKFTITMNEDNYKWEFEAYHKDWNFEDIPVTNDKGWVRYLWRQDNLLECVITLKENNGTYRIVIYINDDDSICMEMYSVGWRDFKRLGFYGMGYYKENL